MRSTMFGAAQGVVATILVAIAVWLAVVYSGAYNVAATEPHIDVVRWTLETTMRRSVASRVGSLTAPRHPADELIAEGARHYAESCVYCHGAPGQEPAEWSRGMRPEPPHLVEAASEWTPSELHWIIENGIKMTGMPAFGPHHNAEQIRAISAFVTRLPGLAPQDYRALTGQGHGGG